MTPGAAEPFMPAESSPVLENLAFDLAREARAPREQQLSASIALYPLQARVLAVVVTVKLLSAIENLRLRGVTKAWNN